jgi:hypothetical protein
MTFSRYPFINEHHMSIYGSHAGNPPEAIGRQKCTGRSWKNRHGNMGFTHRTILIGWGSPDFEFSLIGVL